MQPQAYQSFFSRNAPEARPNIWDLPRGKYDFAIAYPDPNTIPFAGLHAAMGEALEAEGKDLALYLSTQGYPPLRQFVSDKLACDRGIHVGADDVMLTSGAGQAIHISLEMLIDPGDVILADDFTYSGGLWQMRRFRADVRGVLTDEEGMLPDALEAAIQRADQEGKHPKLLYLIPTFQNPLGWTMSLERRKAILSIAQQHSILILEDDCYGDLRYNGVEIPSLFALDAAREASGHVIYISTFSKTIAPGVRTGYMTAPRPLLDRALMTKSGGPVPLLVTFTLHRYMKENLASHIEQINDLQMRKRDAMLQSLADHFTGSATWLAPEGGLSMWVRFPQEVDVNPMRIKILQEYGVGYSPGNNYACDRTSGKNCMRLSWGFNQPDEIYEGMALLAKAFRQEGILKG